MSRVRILARKVIKHPSVRVERTLSLIRRCNRSLSGGSLEEKALLTPFGDETMSGTDRSTDDAHRYRFTVLQLAKEAMKPDVGTCTDVSKAIMPR